MTTMAGKKRAARRLAATTIAGSNRHARAALDPMTALAQRRHIRLGIALAVTLFITLATFLPVVFCKFVNFDDDGYVTANPIVQQGLTWNGIIWAFTSTPLNLWHPLSFVSLMCDVEIFGLNPAGFHAVNLLIHLANVALVLLLLYQLTQCVWRSALACALFAVHPLRVESVAWIAERKDLLAMFFGLLALLAYAAYARRPSAWPYLWMLIAYALSMLAKPMLLPLAGILLALDAWPLGRFADGHRSGDAERSDAKRGDGNRGDAERGDAERGDAAASGRKPALPPPLRRLTWLLVEKLPVVFIALLFVWLIQHFLKLHPPKDSDAIVQGATARQENAIVSYLLYLKSMICCTNLAVLYPLRRAPTAWELCWAIGLLLAISALAIGWARSKPWLIVGWTWYLLALAPVIGFGPQVGFHAMADRYLYFPSIGILIAAVWSIPQGWLQWRPTRLALAGGTLAVVAALCILTVRQIGYWHDSITLFEHAAAVTQCNDFAEYSLGNAYWRERHDPAKSVAHFQAALALRPDMTSAHDNLGVVLAATGYGQEAISHFEQAIAIKPDCAPAYDNWATVLARRRDFTAAIGLQRKAIASDATYLPARLNLAYSLMQVGQYDESAAQLETALAMSPGNPMALAMLRDVGRKKAPTLQR